MAKEDEKKEDEKLTPVGDGIETSEKEEKTEASEEATDEKVGHAEEDDEEPEESEGSGDPVERLRERRRAAKKRKSQRIQSDRRELDFLRRRNEDVERQLSQVMLRQEKSEVASLDQRIGQLESQISEAEGIHSQAVEAKDGQTATEALRVAGALRETLNKIKGEKEDRAKTREQDEQSRQPQPRGPDPEAIRNAKDWFEDNRSWFDPNLADDDSYLVRALEERLAREGRFDPRDPAYWEELDRRIEKRLPHLKERKKVKEDADDDLEWGDDDEKTTKRPAKKPGGPRIAVGGKTRSLKPNEVYISEQRKKALMDAGVWDDEEKRERFLKSYKKWDEEAARNS